MEYIKYIKWYNRSMYPTRDTERVEILSKKTETSWKRNNLFQKDSGENSDSKNKMTRENGTFNRDGRDGRRDNKSGEDLRTHILKVQIEEGGVNPLPYKDNTGYKLLASQSVSFQPGEIHLVNTGIKIELTPISPYMKIDIQMNSTKELEAKHLYIVNNPGTIDMDYRGEIKVILWNYSQNEVIISPSDIVGKLSFYRRITGNITIFEDEKDGDNTEDVETAENQTNQYKEDVDNTENVENAEYAEEAQKEEKGN